MIVLVFIDFVLVEAVTIFYIFDGKALSIYIFHAVGYFSVIRMV